MDALTLPDIAPCSCERCRRMCEERPCWPTPAEAIALLDAGRGSSLMLDYWSGGFPSPEDEFPDSVDILGPAIVGCEGRGAPFWPGGRCTFLSQQGLCSLHDRGLKPAEGRKAGHVTPDGLHKAVARTWDSDLGRAAVARWRAEGAR